MMEVEKFGKASKTNDGLQSYCKICNAKSVREAYKNSPGYRASVRDSAKKRKIKIQVSHLEYLADHPCVDCGESNPILLDLDHVRGKKISDVSLLRTKKVSQDKIITEIEKCKVRCVRCHRLKTAKSQRWFKNLPKEIRSKYLDCKR